MIGQKNKILNLNTFLMGPPCIYLKSLLDNRVYILQCLSVCPFFSRNGQTIRKRMMMMTTRTTTMRTTALMTTTTTMKTIKEIGLGDLQKRDKEKNYGIGATSCTPCEVEWSPICNLKEINKCIFLNVSFF